MHNAGIQIIFPDRIQNSLGCQRFRLAVTPNNLIRIKFGYFFNLSAFRQFRDCSGTADIDQLAAFLVL
jgi:hypothetical protein